MAVYKVTAGQNIWDVAIQCCGTIEGVFDLLICNPKLSMITDLTPGMELEYHDYFVIKKDVVSSLRSENITPSNGERHVYYKHTDEPLVFICKVSPDQHSLDFSISGSGEMIVDWGDNTPMETIKLGNKLVRVLHYFDNMVDERRVKIYGQFNVLTLDTTMLNGELFTVRPVVVDEFVSKSNNNSLKGLFLFDGMVKADLSGMTISDLSSLCHHMNLQELNLSDVQFTEIDVLDSYLVSIVENYSNRRNCTVYLSVEPTEKGMAAIQTIINEPEWNEAGKWKFIINDIEYTQD